jgi:hypothetical protein
MESERTKRGYMRLRRQMTDEERHLLNAELQLDSFIQEKVKNLKKVAIALAEIRAIRNSRIARGFSWQYTLTNPKIPSADKARKWFGYEHENKTWTYRATGALPRLVVKSEAGARE